MPEKLRGRADAMEAGLGATFGDTPMALREAAGEIERLRAAMAAIRDNAAISQDDDAIWMDDRTPLAQFIDATLGTNNDDYDI